MRYDLHAIMRRAWVLFRKGVRQSLTFAEALHRSWLSAKAAPINTQRIEAAKAASNIAEEVNTWPGWKSLGYEVIHGSKARFQVVLIYGSKGDGATYTGSFFTASQVQPIVTTK